MPELPEVESVRTDLLAIVGTELRPLTTSRYPRFSAAAQAAGFVRDVSRRGKWIIMPLDTQLGRFDLIIHLGMTGRVTLSSSPQDLSHLHASWAVDGHPSVSWMGFCDPRRFGRLAVVPHGEYGELPGLDGLGPDATDAPAAAAALAGLSGSSRPIKAALLDQSVIAGAGNIYCDEALFAAGISPTRPSGTLTDSERADLSAALAGVLRASIALGGTTFRDYRRTDGASGRNSENLRVYGRAGSACTACSAPLCTGTVAGRTTVWCADCQR